MKFKELFMRSKVFKLQSLKIMTKDYSFSKTILWYPEKYYFAIMKIKALGTLSTELICGKQSI